MTRLGYQIPNFTYPDVGPAELFDVVAKQAAAADRAADPRCVVDGACPDPVHERTLEYDAWTTRSSPRSARSGSSRWRSSLSASRANCASSDSWPAHKSPPDMDSPTLRLIRGTRTSHTLLARSAI